jgi:hypothetical protein
MTDDDKQAMRELFTYDMGTVHAVCQYCAALVLPTDDGKRLHVAWHALVQPELVAEREETPGPPP